MSRSRSPERDHDRHRRMSMSSNLSHPDVDETPAKSVRLGRSQLIRRRMRPDARTEDKARGKRLFGNILGTLQKFKTEDKSKRGSEAEKRRAQVSERIQAKIRSEATLHHEIAESERELKTLRIQTDSAEYVLKHKEAAMSARHASLRPTSRFLHTSPQALAPPLFEGKLLNPSPIPLNHGPFRESPHGELLRPLYFLPKVLLPDQDDALNSQIANIDELIADEAADLAQEKEITFETARKNRARIAELLDKLDGLKRQVKPAGPKPETDELGRMPREEMDVDREAGVQIRGDDGDVEVEY